LDPDCKILQNLGSGRIGTLFNRKEMQHFCCEKAEFPNILNFIWTWTLHLKKILDCDWTWTEFFKIRTGSGSQNMTVYLSSRRLHTESGYGLLSGLWPTGDPDYSKFCWIWIGFGL